jgi:putative colanic acid biosynthesis glycosyltransferase
MLTGLFGGNKMKVLQINSVCGIGSTGRIATDIHAILIDNSHESYIAFGRGIPINCDTTIRIGNKIDNYLHVSKTRIFDQHGFGSKKATKEFIAKVKKLDPDLIHLHNIHGYYLNVEILFEYLKEANKPVVWTLHDCWAFTGHCAYFDFAGCDCWKVEGVHKCIQKESYPASLIINNSKDNYERKRSAFTGVRNLKIITPSKWLAELVKESFLCEYPVQVINNGIDLTVFQTIRSDFRKKYNIKDKFIILGVSNIWEKRKGLEYFLEISKSLNKDEVIVLIGLNKKQMEKLPSNIIGITRTNSAAELAEIYSTSDVFVNPTLEDNFPTTNLESLACGTPIITFHTGGSIEAVDEKTGFIVEKFNTKALYKAIQKVKIAGKSAFTENCVERASLLYDKKERYNDYIDLYTDLITS